jgi:hypothetical protein
MPFAVQKNSGQAFCRHVKQHPLNRIWKKERGWAVGQRYQETKKKNAQTQAPQAFSQDTPSETKGQIMVVSYRFSLTTKMPPAALEQAAGGIFSATAALLGQRFEIFQKLRIGRQHKRVLFIQ